MKNPISLKLLYLLSKICYWGLIVVIGIVVFAGAVMLILDPQLMKLGFASDLIHMEEVLYLKTAENTPVEVEFIAESIRIPVKHLDRPTMATRLFISLLWLFGLLYVIRLFKSFFKMALDGQTFRSDSISLLKKAALVLVIIEAIELMDAIIGYYYVQNNFDLGDIEQTFQWPFPSTALIVALILWSLAHIFQKAKELEDEQKLTV